jgi:glycine oxidase
MKGGRYLIPRLDGRILVGSTLEEAGFDCSTTESAGRDLLDAAIALMPGLAGLDVEAQWAGLRPSSPEGVPYIGEHPEIAGLWVCSGHYRNGIVLGPASARLLAGLLHGGSPIISPEPYAQGGLRAS